MKEKQGGIKGDSKQRGLGTNPRKFGILAEGDGELHFWLSIPIKIENIFWRKIKRVLLGNVDDGSKQKKIQRK